MNNQSSTLNQVSLVNLGQQLARYRLSKNLAQEELAKESGVGINTVYRIEQGQSIQLLNLIRIMRTLGLADSLDQLIPSLPASPIEQMQQKKSERQRASRRNENKHQSTKWKWGDEQ